MQLFTKISNGKNNFISVKDGVNRSMIILAVIFSFFGISVNGQTTANYVFSTNATGSLALASGTPVDMSTGTTQLLAASQDITASAVTNIGFDFFFMGTRFTQFSINADGLFELGNGTIPTLTYDIKDGTLAAPILSAFNADMVTGTTGKIHYKVFGTAPNRVLVVEFLNMMLFYDTPFTAGTSTWQIRLYENSGLIEYVYGTMSATDVTVAAASRKPPIGFYTGSGSGKFATTTYASQVNSTSTYAANPAVASGVINNLNSAANGSRRNYKYTPIVTAAPTALNFTAVTATSMTLNWSAAAPITNVLKYAVYQSIDGGATYSFINTTAAGTNTLSVSGLTGGTTYMWKVYSLSEGALSTALTGTQATSTPPTITAVTVPSGTCAATSHIITANVTTSVGTITSVTLNYNNGSAGSLPMTITTGSTYSAAIPAGAPGARVTWSITAINSSAASTTIQGTQYADDPLANATVLASGSPASVCSGSSVTLSVAFTNDGTATLGAGASTSNAGNGAAAQLSPFLKVFGSVKSQYLVPASELQAIGLHAGNIKALGLNVATADGIPLQDLAVSIAPTALTAQPATLITTGLVNVYAGTFTPVVGINTLPFNVTNFSWDGTSNIIIQICWGNNNTGDGNVAYRVKYDATAYVSNAFYRTNSLTGAASCSSVSGADAGTNSARPQFIFSGVTAQTPTAYSWSDGTNTVGITNPLSVTVTTNTSYTATITSLGCLKASNAAAITVMASPAAPGANNSTQCGTAVPAAFVTSSGGGGGFKWYDASTGGTLLQDGGATYAGSVNTTTHFWVSESNGICEGTRAEVIATVNQPDPVSASVDNNNPCVNTAIFLTGANTAASPVNNYSYSWTATPSAGSGLSASTNGNPLSVTPTIPGSYVYTVTAVDGICTTTNTVSITVKAPPAAVVITPSVPAAICTGNSTSLTAVSGGPAISNANSGTISTNIPDVSAAGISNALAISGIPAGSTIDSVIVTFSITHPDCQDILVNLTAPNNQIINLVSGGTGFITSGVNFTNTSISSDNSKPAIPATGAPFTATYRADKATTGFELAPSPSPTTNVFSNLFTIPNGNWTLKVEDDESIGTGTLTNWSIKIAYSLPGDPITWLPATGLNSTSGSTVIASPATTTTYTATATNAAGCTNTNIVTVTVNQLPPAPSPTNGTDQCGTSLTDASVSSNSGETSPNFNWYLVPTGGTPVQTGTSTTYLTAISETTTFYVSEISSFGCEGSRTTLTTVVSAPDPLTVSASSPTVCLGGSTDISSAYTPDFNSFGSYTLTVSPEAGSGITNPVTLTSNIDNNGSDPYTVTPAAIGTYTYTITAIDPDKGCTATNTVTVSVNSLPVITNVSATPSTACTGASVSLAASTVFLTTGNVNLGTAVTVTSTTGITPFSALYEGSREQYLVRAGELTALGLAAGNLTSLAFNVTDAGSFTQSGFTIKIAKTSNNTLNGGYGTPVGSFVNVYGPVALTTPATGLNTFAFTTPFAWDGVSNILVDICHDNDISNSCASCFGDNSTVTYTNTSFKSVYGSYADNIQSCAATATNIISTFTNRPNMIFGGQLGDDHTADNSWTWNPGNLSGNIVTVHPTTTTTYTATATRAGCSANSSPVIVTIVPVGANATATPNTSVCAGTAVTLNGGATGGGPFTYSWSNGATVVGTTSPLTVNPAVTTTYTVTVTDNCGNTATSSVTINVNPLPTASIVEAGPIAICAPSTQTLTASTNAISPTYQWLLNDSNIPGATSPTYAVTATGSYKVIVTESGTGCISAAAAAVVVNINARPSAVAVTPATSTICNGAIVSLTGSSSSTLSVTSGTGAAISDGNVTTSTLGPNPFQVYYGGDKQQSLYLASELSALGMSAGSVISAVKFNLPTADPSVSLASLRIKMKNTTTSSLATTWESGLTIVRTAAAFAPAVGINTLALNTPFTWDGTGNLVIEVTYSNNNGGTAGSIFNTAKYSPTSFPSTIFYRVDDAGAAALNTYTGAVSFSYNSRNDMTFDFTTPASITWSPSTGLYTNAGATTAYTGTAATAVFAKPLTTTTYTATATNSFGCTNTGAAVITVNPRPTGIISGTGTYCNGANTATSLNIAVTGTGPWSGTVTNGTATTPFSGSISPITVSVTPTATSTYTIAALNGSACSSIAADLSGTATVTINPRPSGVISGTGTYCNGANTATALSIAVTGAGPWSGTLSDGTLFSGSASPVSVSVTPTATSTYTIATLSGSQCSSIAADLTGTATVTVNPRPAGVISGTGTYCNGANTTTVLHIAVTGAGPWNGTITDGTNTTPFSGTTSPVSVSVTPTATSTYTIATLNGSACSSIAADLSGTATVTINPRPTGVISGSATYCSGAGQPTQLSIAVTGAGPWSGTLSNGTPFSGSASPISVTVPAVTTTTTYTIATLHGSQCDAIAADLSGTATVTINPPAGTPTANVTQPTCVLGTGTITVTAPLGAGNSYTLDGTTTISWPAVSFPGVAPGDHILSAQNSFGCFSPASTTVTVNPQPITPAAPTVTGIVNVCIYIGTGQQLTYHATAAGATLFTWTVPANVTIISGQGTADLTVTFNNGFADNGNKQIRVTAGSVCGTSTFTIFYLVAQYPMTPQPITGPTDVCPFLGGPSTATYTINKALNATGYIWSAQAGVIINETNGPGVNDTTVTVSFPAGFTTSTITVVAKNDCGLSGPRSITVTRNNPGAPSPVSGPTNACPFIAPGGTPATYSVTATAGITYNWTVPSGATGLTGQGTNSISFTYPAGFTSGTVSVTATSGCGTGPSRSLSITRLTPATPGVIDVIQTHFCGDEGGRTFTYTLSSMPANATSVQWTVPTAAGAAIVSGQGSISILVSYPDASVNGVVTAQGVNNCGQSTLRSTTVKLPTCPPQGFAANNNGNGNNPAATKGNTVTTQTQQPIAESMDVRIFPNPTVSDFKLEVLTSAKEEINVRVIDNEGRLFKTFKVMPYQTVALGSELKTGSYLVEVRQGKNVKTTKVIKF